MKLRRLLEAITDYTPEGDMEVDIKGLAYDSRTVQPGDLFIAVRGTSQDGHDYCRDAVRKGAAGLVMEDWKEPGSRITRIRVPDSREALSKLSARFYDYPYEKMDIIGITGTNGKTTTSYMIESILYASGASPGVIGTVSTRFGGRTRPASVTTPESLDLMRVMREMADEDVTHVILEVSSHALDQGRTRDCPFRVALFTNFSRDHLDYHTTMENYFKAKSRIFQDLHRGRHGKESVAVINMDDVKGKELLSFIRTRVMTYGLDHRCDVRAETISSGKEGLRLRLFTPRGETEVTSSLIGNVNIYNILAAAASALALDIGLDAISRGIESLPGVPGRLESVKNPRGLSVVVDYAHTPDALLKAQETLAPIVQGRLITVFGCGGDRDRGKRSEMGLVAGKYSDIVIITSDNPRSEDPESIVSQIEAGMKQSGQIKREWSQGARGAASGYFIEADRREAIRKAVSMATEDDLILIAGKGHEDYQIIGSEKRFFDDRKEVVAAAS